MHEESMNSHACVCGAPLQEVTYTQSSLFDSYDDANFSVVWCLECGVLSLTSEDQND